MTRVHGIGNSGDFIGSDCDFLSLYTLVDITKTGVIRSYNLSLPAFTDDAGQIVNTENSWNRSRNQQSNFETSVQTIMMRAAPVHLNVPDIRTSQALASYSFGSNYTGTHTVWVLSFSVEHAGVFDYQLTSLLGLQNDFTGTPIVDSLTETVTLASAVFDAGSSSNDRNIYFSTSTTIGPIA